MSIYIAKNKRGWYYLWHDKPHYEGIVDDWQGNGFMDFLEDDEVPKDLTFENSPIEVELKIKEN